ncbi:GNAT family N-acetyltransferase [Sedimentibacter sp.]|uniref:GNAT family N-acetyltransferase n=1 Tax=Sedimentibacter sp. TaxID=1960295 RepID=UPI000ED413CC|nr:GNAT family N-acetyltransferase [Sedimentibacter sp.]HCX62241.1 GNAT family N-acetyltransferase [Clostridiales bacterium]
MKSISDDNERVIEFNYIDSDMIEEIRQLFLEYAESLGVDLNFQDFESEINSLPGKYEPPDGILILASVNGKSAGCVALRRLSKDICEMKRLYIRDEYRRLGIGKKLIVMIIEEAKKLKYRYMRLDTLPTMKKAQELYASLGFYDIEPYVYNPIEGTRFLELIL